MTDRIHQKKKLIEVALPLDAINKASVLEKQPFTRRHPRSIHIWWARRPMAAARAVIFAQMVDDPSAHPDLFPTEKAQEKERRRLFRIIEDLVKWENTTNEEILQMARDEIWQSWRYTCAENADHPKAKELFDRYRLPAFHDPFAGGGALPLEAQRLGLEAYSSDLNPVAVLINKAMIEIPPKFVGKPPVNPEARADKELFQKEWKGAQGLAEDVRYYGKWMRDEAEKRIGHYYPKIDVTAEMAKERPDLKKYVGQKLTGIAWLWSRTVRCPNPACACEMPLISSLVLSSRPGKECYLNPLIEGSRVRFGLQSVPPTAVADPKKGYKRGMSGIFECVFCGTVTTRNYVAQQAMEQGLALIHTAIVAEGDRGRVFLPAEANPIPTDIQGVDPMGLDAELAPNPRDVWCRNFGLLRPIDLFTSRQLVALTTFSDLVQEAREQVKRDALAAGLTDDNKPLFMNGVSITAYADAMAVYLGLASSRWSDLSNSLCSWNSTNQNIRALFARQAIPMTWDFVELSPFSKVGSWFSTIESSIEATASLVPEQFGSAIQADATVQAISQDKCVSTDPPYYDNISYADLSDFFYVWLRRSLKPIFPDIFSTLTVPKTEELVAMTYRHGTKRKAEAFFLDGMTQAMHRLAEQTHPAFPVTIYYAFKQSETKSKSGVFSTGWETFLDAVFHAGFAVTGTWPIRTEREARSVGLGTNSLASSIILVCRRRMNDAPTVTRREFVTTLKIKLPIALARLQRGNIAPVDLAQAAIGPGMAVYTQYAQVLDAEGKPLSVRDALALINQTLDEVLTEQEGYFDADSRWALAWFEQLGFSEGEYGVAETLSKAKNTSIQGMVEDGILVAKSGKVRLFRPEELSDSWDPEKDKRLTAWEMVHQLIRVFESGGEPVAAILVAKLGSRAEITRELAYRLYMICERKKRTVEALSYNALVQSWPEIIRLAQTTDRSGAQGPLFERNEE